MELQSRAKSAMFWVGLVSVVVTAFVNFSVAAGQELPWWIGGIGAAFSAVLLYCNGNNPSLKDKY